MDNAERLFQLSADLLGVAGMDGFFKEVNPAFERVLGHSLDEIKKRPFLEFVHPEDRDATLAEMKKLEGGAVTLHFENRYRCKDGSYKWLQWTSTPDLKRGLLFAVARDVTQLKEQEERLRRAEDVAAGGVLRIRPFVALRGALLVHEKIAEAALDRARRAFEEKLAFFGSKLESARAVSGTPEALAQALREEQGKGTQLLVLAGSRSMDPQDPVLRGLELAGARMERHGVPAYPGTLLWVAYLGDVPVLGAPSCGIFSRATSLDLLLPRVMTGERLRATEIAGLAAGGIVAPETSYRLAPYKAGAPRGQLE